MITGKSANLPRVTGLVAAYDAGFMPVAAGIDYW
jgi:hypothetical protein